MDVLFIIQKPMILWILIFLIKYNYWRCGIKICNIIIITIYKYYKYFNVKNNTAQQLADRLGDQQAVECSETKWSFEKTPFCF